MQLHYMLYRHVVIMPAYRYEYESGIMLAFWCDNKASTARNL